MENERVDLVDRLRGSIGVKVTVVVLLVLLFLVPWGVVFAIVSERTSRRAQAVTEVSAIWGGAQEVGAVVLTVPYSDGPTGGVVRVLPEALDVKAEMVPSTRLRGVFPVTVYTVRLTLTGRFHRPDPAAVGVDPSALRWDRARLVVGMTHTKSVSPDASLTWAGERVTLAPSLDTADGLFARGLEAAIPNLADAPQVAALPFGLTLELKGTRSLNFQPVGRVTTVALSSSWKDPSFTGAFLPDNRQTDPSGFRASWRVGSFGRGYPQAWRTAEARRTADGSYTPVTNLADAGAAAAFGVDLMTTVDLYQQTERSVKYGMLFVGLTFLVFLLVEVLRGARVHPVQYLLVGGALMVFYLLLLSLAEQVGFGAAYLVAAAATVGLITMYASNAFRSRRDGSLAGAVLAGLYGTLFVLLRLEDAALLVGALLLFAVLASVMYLTRRVDWYALSLPSAAPEPTTILPREGGR